MGIRFSKSRRTNDGDSSESPEASRFDLSLSSNLPRRSLLKRPLSDRRFPSVTERSRNDDTKTAVSELSTPGPATKFQRTGKSGDPKRRPLQAQDSSPKEKSRFMKATLRQSEQATLGKLTGSFSTEIPPDIPKEIFVYSYRKAVPSSFCSGVFCYRDQRISLPLAETDSDSFQAPQPNPNPGNLVDPGVAQKSSQSGANPAPVSWSPPVRCIQKSRQSGANPAPVSWSAPVSCIKSSRSGTNLVQNPGSLVDPGVAQNPGILVSPGAVQNPGSARVDPSVAPSSPADNSRTSTSQSVLSVLDDTDIETVSFETTGPRTVASAPTAILGDNDNSLGLRDEGLPLWPPPDEDLLEAVKAALAWVPADRTVPIFDFRLCQRAAEHNFEILQRYDFDLQRILLEDPFSPVRPGSEFRPAALLDPIFSGHPLWPRFRRSLLHGASADLVPIDEIRRKQDLSDAIEYGNHKSATNEAPLLVDILEKEATKGWQLPLPIDKLHRIPGVVVGPLGLAHQDTIDETGQIIPKERLTHDQSFAFSSKQSVNLRLIESSLTPCQYGFALPRFCHAIIQLRQKYPTLPILLCKFDFKSAYRRLHAAAVTALQSVVTTKGLQESPVALASLRATFGGSNWPSQWSDVSEPIADLVQVLRSCETWDPNRTQSIHHGLIGAPRLAEADIPFAAAKPMMVDPGVGECGTTEVFLDDIFSAFPALSKSHVQRGSQATLLALEIIARPLLENETVSRDDMLAIAKALAEGTPSEELTILGWIVDTRRLLVKLPQNKFIAWSQSIRDLLSRRGQRVDFSTLETLVGRLQHVANVLRISCHFLNHLRAAMLRAKKYGGTRLHKEANLDLELWLTFLESAASGIDMNLIVSRQPDRIIRTDACKSDYKEGLGGFSYTTGRAWRWEVPPELRGRKTLNYLEYLASVVGILLDLYECGDDIRTSTCFLAVGDSTTGLGWLRRSNFADLDEHASHSALARYFALTLEAWGACLFTQWFMGKLNSVADELSREFRMSDEDLTDRLLLSYPEQIPHGFRLSPLPPKITSLLHYWVQHEQGTTESPPVLTRKRPDPGTGGSLFSTNASSPMTPTLTASVRGTATASLEHLHTRSESKRGRNLQKDMITWLRRHASPPSRVYARPSSQATDPTRPWIKTARLHSFYSDSSKDIETMTLLPSPRKRSHSLS